MHRRSSLAIAGFLALCGLPVVGSVRLWSTSRSWWPLAVYATASVVSFLQYRADKSRAVGGRRRTSERSLHVVELLGGWPGAWWAQQVLRHKSRKLSYQAVFWLVVAVHQVSWALWLLFGAAGGRWWTGVLASFS